MERKLKLFSIVFQESSLLFFVGIGFRHQKTNLFLRNGSTVNNTGDFSGADDHNSVAKLKQYVKILADENNRNAVFLLLGEQVINRIGKREPKYGGFEVGADFKLWQNNGSRLIT